MIKRVVIVGKPNVGKSQLFNRLVGEKHSIVYSEPGITRDRISLEVCWLGKKFILTDTGGYTPDIKSFQEDINRQTEIAFREADLILFLISAKDGIDNDDYYLSKKLKKNSIPVLLVANKCDGNTNEIVKYEQYKLGFGEALFVSAEHGINTGALLNEVVSRIGGYEGDSEERVKIAIIGKPNVGKSSLVNALLKEERIITSPIAGTTRDAIDLDFDYLSNKYTLIDTPGIRRHASVRDDEKEKLSILRAKKAISRANVLVLLFDISEPLSELDERIGGLIYKANIPTLLVANKWDLVERSDENRRTLEKEIRRKFKFLSWAPITFISVKERDKLESIFRKIEEIKEETRKKIPQGSLSVFLHRISSLFPIPSVRGRKLKLFSMEQKEGQVPTFLFLCNDPELLHFSYSRLIENQIRSGFGYHKTPLTVIFKKKN